MAACHDEADRFMAAFQSALKKDGVPERALADRLFTLAHRMLSATVEVDPSSSRTTRKQRQHRAQRAALEQLQRAFKTEAPSRASRATLAVARPALRRLLPLHGRAEARRGRRTAAGSRRPSAHADPPSRRSR